MATAPSIDSILESFPYPNIPPIQGQPTYQSIADLTKTACENAASVPSVSGGGAHGHLGIVLSDAQYTALTGVAYNPPVDPGPTPTIPPGTTGPQIAAIERQFKEEQRIFQTHANVDAALKQQIQNAVPKKYIKNLANRQTGFLGVTARQMLTHLQQRYG